MKIIKPVAMTNAQLTSSNVSEADYAAWDISTTYALADNVIVVASTHKIYTSAQASNLGNNPVTDDGTWWTEVSATNRWKCFDSKIANQCSNSGSITFVLNMTKTIGGLAFFGLNAANVQVRVFDDASPAVSIYDMTIELVDDTEIIDWYTFYTTDLTDYQTEALFANVPALAGYEIRITIGDGVGTAYVGEIVLGKVVKLGDTIEGTEIGLTSFSTKAQDSFGNWNITSRAKSDPIDFQFAMNADDAGRVKRVLNELRDTAAVYFADETLTDMGAITYGLFQDYSIPLRKQGKSIVTLEVDGLT